MIRCISRRLERLETLTAAKCRTPIVFRVHLVDPELGLTGVLVIEGDKPMMTVAGTPEEVEKVRCRFRAPPGGSPAMEGRHH